MFRLYLKTLRQRMSWDVGMVWVMTKSQQDSTETAQEKKKTGKTITGRMKRQQLDAKQNPCTNKELKNI